MAAPDHSACVLFVLGFSSIGKYHNGIQELDLLNWMLKVFAYFGYLRVHIKIQNF